MRIRLLLVLAALAAFGASLWGSFQFDDLALFSDPAITSPSGWIDCFRIAQTRPLTWLTFWMNFQIGGHDPMGYHALNLILHAAVVLLLFEVLRPKDLAAIAAGIFAVHPLLTEPVDYIFSRAILLATVFCLLSIRSWLNGRLTSAVLWFLAAMLAKEECAALPLFFVLLHFKEKREHREWRAIAWMLGIAVALGARVIWAIKVTPGAWAGSKAGISPLHYLTAQGGVILRYLVHLIVPWGFSVDPPAPATPWWLAWPVLIAFVIIASIRFRKTWTAFWFLGGLILLTPSSSIFPASDLAADRRMYLPMIAFAPAMALLARKLDKRVAAAILAALIAISIHYTLIWRTPESLWTQALDLAPEKIRPRIQLARALSPDRALPILDEAARLNPNDADVPTEQGRVLLALRRPAEALSRFGRALALDPADAPKINNRGVALAALGQPDAARADFERALKRDPCLFDAYLNLRKLGAPPQVPSSCRFTPEQRAQLNP